MTASPRTIRLDLHLHTRASWDCLSDPEALLREPRSAASIASPSPTTTALTWLWRCTGGSRTASFRGKRYGPGRGSTSSVSTSAGRFPGGTPARDTCRLIREDGGIVYLPHPFARGKGGSGRHAEALAPLVDVVEVFNARLHPGRLNEPAEALARSHGKLRGAGSDAHTLGEVGGAWVEVPYHESSPEALLAALASGQVEGRTAPVWTHVASTWAKVHHAFPGARVGHAEGPPAIDGGRPAMLPLRSRRLTVTEPCLSFTDP
jgi:hypothetical protein